VPRSTPSRLFLDALDATAAASSARDFPNERFGSGDIAPTTMHIPCAPMSARLCGPPTAAEARPSRGRESSKTTSARETRRFRVAYASQRASSMKPVTLGLVVAMGLFAIGCGADPEEESAPPEPVKHVASSLERKLTPSVAIPTDTAIGGSIDAVIAAQKTLVAREPIVNLGANGKRCTIVRFDDAKGVEQMRREQCDRGADMLRAGKVVYTDTNSDAKIDQVSDSTSGTYDLFDDDHDGKVDRMLESPDRIATPIALTDFAESVTIMGGGTIASRAREDKDHDGRFDVESVTATTSFQITVTAAPAEAEAEPTP
jgi:hypothetical protein